MKKVGILTFHYSDNYGAVLQAYALRSTINRLPGCHAQIINYIPFGTKYTLCANTEEGRELLIEKRKLFEGFLRENCDINTPVIHEISGNDYDYYCVGSDQVWNMSSLKEEYFFPNISDGAFRISYAASIGMSLEETRQYTELFQTHLARFKSISLREDEHVDFIRQLCKKDCQHVLDPTLLLLGEEYEPLLAKDTLVGEDFIFFFWLRQDMNLGLEIVNSLSRKYKLPIVHSILGAKKYTFRSVKKCMYGEGIENFLWYIRNARFVVTNSYHATLFSIQFRTPFYVIPEKSMKSRMDTLGKLLPVKDRILYHSIPTEKLDGSIDFDEIHNALTAARKKSISFLKDALDIEQEKEESTWKKQ